MANGQNLLGNMNRPELEVTVLENDILPCDTAAELDVITAMTDAALRDVIHAWILAGDECAASGSRV